MLELDENFWTGRYLNGTTGWDIGYPSPPLNQYLCQIRNKSIRVLVPGAGNGYEVSLARDLGLSEVHLLDISEVPLSLFLEGNPGFPINQIHREDFFDHSGSYDLVLEQTFFCAIDPALRSRYAEKMFGLLADDGLLVGVLFDREFEGGPPFGGSKKEYISYFEPYFHIEIMEPCYNSIPQRQGSELFIKLRKRSDIQH